MKLNITINIMILKILFRESGFFFISAKVRLKILFFKLPINHPLKDWLRDTKYELLVTLFIMKLFVQVNIQYWSRSKKCSFSLRHQQNHLYWKWIDVNFATKNFLISSKAIGILPKLKWWILSECLKKTPNTLLNLCVHVWFWKLLIFHVFHFQRVPLI